MNLEGLYKHEKDIKKELIGALQEAKLDYEEKEPKIVAKILSSLVGVLNGNISNLINEPGLTVSAGGVFVHQQPQVKSVDFPRENAVEIGDLLMVMSFERENGTIDRTALLYQVKKDGHPDRNENQQYLYKNWPHFKYTRSTPRLNGKERQVTGPHLYNGARYLYLYKMSCCCNYRIDKYIKTAAPQGDRYRTGFINELYRFIVGNSGRQFDYQPSGNNINWDQVITDLLDITAHNVTSYYRDTMVKKLPRGQGMFQMMGNFDGPGIVGQKVPGDVIAGLSENNLNIHDDMDSDVYDKRDTPEALCGANILEINITPSNQ